MVYPVKQSLIFMWLTKLVRSLTNAKIASMALHISIENSEAESFAIDLLKNGQIIAVPTDTVYGLACCATDVDAINKLYLIKARNENKPLAICVGEVNDVQRWAVVGHLPKGLLSALLPGPVTLVLRCANKLDQSLSSYGKVGIRIPDYSFIRNVANGLNCPIALTSANISSKPSSVRTEEFKQLWDKISCVFDGGILGIDNSNRGASTVIDLCDPGFYKIMRKGIAGQETSDILKTYGLKSFVRAATGSKETLIKSSITTQLSNIVKEIQLYTMDEAISNDSLQMSEAESTLCAVIEAMFLHGLKDSLAHRARRAIADVDERPEPNFWAPLLVISHRQIIDQITNLSQIATDIGQCRAWIRIVLNDCLLSSYLSSMREDASVLKPYYNTYAYVRDSELLDVAQRLIEGVETFTEFTLPCNTSLLNTWQLQSLVLAGVWSPTLRSCPVAAGVDVAQSLQSTTAINSETGSLSSAISLNSHSSGIGPMLAMNEDEALKIILAKHSSEQHSGVTPSLQPLVEDLKINTSDLSDVETTSVESDTTNFHPEFSLGNSLNRRSGWSFSEAQEKTDESEKEPVSPNAVSANINVDGSKSMETSYNALIESYNMLGGTYIKTPDLREVWQHFEGKSNGEDAQIISAQTPEVLTSTDQSKTEPLPLTAHIGKIAREQGLDFQNYECAVCKEPLALTPKPKVCGFTAEYICDNCMSTESIQLPSRILHNWDFKMYRVSQKALNYLNEIKDHPTIDLKILNPYIYTVSEEMSKLQTLRIQLNFLRDYLYTCREPVIEQLQKQICGREYMYEHVHQYSISDLSQIRSGVLVQHLQTVVNFATEHVQGCWLCSQKGFICEVCSKSKVLYPFDVDNVYRCNICNAVYHNGCLNSTRPCPKCERKRKREDLPLLGATIE